MGLSDRCGALWARSLRSGGWWILPVTAAPSTSRTPFALSHWTCRRRTPRPPGTRPKPWSAMRASQ
eukprot:8735973-Pyramimonas_sp.AAC.1